MSKVVLSPVYKIAQYTPQDAVYDWAIGKQFKSNQHDRLISVSDVAALYQEGFHTLVFTCGGSSTSLELEPPEGPYFAPQGLYWTDELEERRRNFPIRGRDEPLFRGK